MRLVIILSCCLVFMGCEMLGIPGGRSTGSGGKQGAASPGGGDSEGGSASPGSSSPGASGGGGTENQWRTFKEKFDNPLYNASIFFIRTIAASPQVMGMLQRQLEGDTKSHTTQAVQSMLKAYADIPKDQVLQKFASNMEIMEASCKGELQGMPNHRDRTGQVHPYKDRCDWALRWREVFGKALVGNAQHLIVGRAKRADNCTDDFKRNHIWLQKRCFELTYDVEGSRQEIVGILEGWEKSFGTTFDKTELLKPWEEAVAKAIEMRDSVASQATLEEKAKFRHPLSERIAKPQLEKWFNNTKVLKIRMEQANWEITRKGGGIAYRWRSGLVMARLGDEKWCRLFSFNYKEPYAGGGRYEQSDKVEFATQVNIAQCK